jgi:glycosyltransferase involved in cell wall biosynthesis
LEPYKPGEKFVIGHFGSLSETRNLASTIAALDLLIDQQPDLDGRVELHVYGGPLDPISAAAVASARHSTVRHFGRIEADPVTGKSGREQILQRMRSADVLLLLHGVEPICAEYIPSKMYEYLWMQRPILALVHRNPQMAALVRGQGHRAMETGLIGSNATTLNVEICAALAGIAGAWRAHSLVDNDRPSPYTTAASTAQLMGWSRL